MKRRICFPAVFAALFFAVSSFGANKCHAEPILFGPTPYLSAADSPFDLSGLGTTFFLEDFEDGLLNTPGVSLGGLFPGEEIDTNSFARIRLPSPQTDSVDVDDGQIDGDGTLGRSLLPNSSGCTLVADGEGQCFDIFRFGFLSEFDGELPNAVGFVLTDISSISEMMLIAFGDENTIISRFTERSLGDDFDDGNTSEDRFVGVFEATGISQILILVTPQDGQVSEIDHLQYGVVVPEPSSLVLLLIGVFGIAVAYRLRQNCFPLTRMKIG